MLRLRNNKLGKSSPTTAFTNNRPSPVVVVLHASSATRSGVDERPSTPIVASSTARPVQIEVELDFSSSLSPPPSSSSSLKKNDTTEAPTTSIDLDSSGSGTSKSSTGTGTESSNVNNASSSSIFSRSSSASKTNNTKSLWLLPPSPARTLSTVTSHTSSSTPSSPTSTPPTSPTRWLSLDDNENKNKNDSYTKTEQEEETRTNNKNDDQSNGPSNIMRMSTGTRMMPPPPPSSSASSTAPSSSSLPYNNGSHKMKGGTNINNNDIISYSSTAATTTPMSSSAAAAPTSAPLAKTSTSMTMENGTKVWVKKSAVDAVRNPRMSFREKMGRKSSTASNNNSSHAAAAGGGAGSGSSLYGSFNNGSIHGGGLSGSLSSSQHNRSFNRQQSSLNSSFNGSVSSFGGGGGGGVGGGVGGDRDFSDSQSEIGSVGGAVWGNSSAASFFNRTSNLDNGGSGSMTVVANRSSEWGWMQAHMIDSSNGSITLRLSSPDDTAQSTCSLSSTGSSGNTSASIGDLNINDSEPIVLPSTAMSAGDIVFANEYAIDETNGSQLCPDDLISLSHLHEPAVVECLQRRYDADKIYTATGPVLLALNPFQNLRGLYSETAMKQYWERAENTASVKKDEDLPPHVYGMADEAFRSMMRSLEQNLGGGIDSPPSDQSILVSGESGAGKTVTTKFVMKYLAALSQRAASQQSQPVERAYKKVAENKAMRSGSANGASLSSSSSGVQSFVPMSPISGSSTPSWVKKTLKTMTQSDKMDTGSDPDRSVGGSNALSDVTNLAGVGSSAMNSIEAQVLQSNPILESFGNARTMRNDNSSRFGKFIEIQFTRTGRLVGAQIETYLLEKVRLVTQAMGERNYHIFYEMLSGGMPADELRNYYIASTATADDFRMTASGTYDRRDGVSDKETYRALRTAMRTMKISEEEQQDVFATAAALLHASNLSFCDLGDQKSALDGRNIHLEPVCRLLGVSTEALNQALCHFTITAGNESQVQQNLDVDRAEKGLEALLKTTYGALFDFLVARINDSICFTPDDSRQDESRDEPSSPVPIYGKKEAPAASIGVLDIFGFESFQSNSFEQLCINYCNEALQQQFNAFVLKNEQAEYEREGIEWSFIQFPENQDVLDLIDKRGSGILCILDDQCRAPGTSDRSFALDVYNKCKNHVRFSANRKQTAVLQFCVHHYAGPVEYTTDGFVEKNRDELPKEATDLLQNSFNPFIRLMAEIIESTAAERAASSSKTNTPKVFRRQESNIGRATVGGQFRRQLKCLREKIDRMAPHYVRCLKPNDELVPNHFDRAAVAEQLRCGGILEAVRVARAGYSNHYSHEDFLRRYRCLGRNELKEGAASTSVVECRPTAQKKFTAAAVNSYLQNKDTSTGQASSSGKKPSTNPSTIALCTALVKVLCKKLQQQKDDNDENENYSNTYPTQSLSSTPTSNKYQVFAAPPAWARGGTSMRGGRTGGLPPVPFTSTSKTWEKSSNDSRPPTNPEKNRQSFKNVGSSSSTSESAKVGIQIGKTKVFLRHKAFEALERLRSQEQSRAATKLNSVFRMFLARVAYVHVRNAVRKSMYDLRAYEDDEFKECKDQSLDDEQLLAFFNRLNKMRHSYNGQSFSLVELWATQMRESIHNPRPRSEWGKIDPSRPFKWTLVDGLWTKNHDFDD